MGRTRVFAAFKEMNLFSWQFLGILPGQLVLPRQMSAERELPAEQEASYPGCQHSGRFAGVPGERAALLGTEFL